ncbi:TetR/AcrR family transcriptional regulator [Streptosporangium sp. CA-135522]|uniref:TetR/AcrR family transcriptional regulator n=1 Tax=Streptosporangium sp. CA-135522 TaxID=3240072 RepID=UPI003D9120E0
MTDPSAGDRDEFGIPIIVTPMSASERKHKAISDAAIAEFVTEGYAGASVDAIASRAGVSKPTIYSHFGNKERLFLAVIGRYLRSSHTDLGPIAARITEASDLRAALIDYTGTWARIVLRDDIMTLRRLVIGEVHRFPQLGEVWAQTDAVNDEALTAALGELHARGAVRVPQPRHAVRQLIAMTIGAAQLVRTFRPAYEFAEGELDDMISSGVDVFLSHYATRA